MNRDEATSLTQKRYDRQAGLFDFWEAPIEALAFKRLPFRDGAFDAAAATFVFCSVPDPVLGLREVRRVVRQDGGLHLLEHVRSRNPIVGRLMDWTNPLWVRVCGANINRDTVANVQRAGFELDAVESRMFGILKLIRGKVLQAVGASPEAVSDVAHG